MKESCKGEVTPNKFVGSRRKLYTAVIFVDLLYVSTGCVLTWPSPMLPYLLENGGSTMGQASWICSIMPLGAAFGPIVNSLVSPRLGRKKALILNGFLFLISWSLIAVGTDFYYLLAGRFIGGIATGFSFNSIPIYVTEIADDEVRQVVSSLGELFIGIGYMLEFCLGPYLPYRLFQFTSASAAIIFTILFIWMPETPYYLLKKGRDMEAIASLRWFRDGTTDQVTAEFSAIQESLKKVTSKANLLDLFKKRGYRKAYFYCFMLMTIEQISGSNVIVAFNQLLLERTDIPISPAVGAMIFGVVNLIFSCFAPPLVRKFGAKTVLIFCSVAMGFSLEIFALNSFLEDRVHIIPILTYIPVISLVIYNIFFCLGMGPLPWSLIAEISPSDFKEFISASVCTYSWLCSFGQIMAYTSVQQNFGTWPIFVFFGTCLILGAVYIHFFLPETKHMSLAEIQLSLDAGCYANKSEQIMRSQYSEFS